MTTRQRSTSSTSTGPPAWGEVVLGVDTHGEVHVAAVVCPLGQILGTKSFPATAVGYRRLLAWARTLGTVRRARCEGTGTFGAGLSRYLLAQHVVVFEVNRPDRLARRLLGKSEPARRTGCRAGRAQRSREGPSQNWRRSVPGRRMFELRQGLRGQGPYPGDQPLKAVLVIADPALRSGCQPGQPRAVPHLRAPQPARRRRRRGDRGRRGGGHPHHPEPAGPAHRAVNRADR